MTTELLEAVIAAHGGRELWRATSTLVVQLKFGGLAFASRFNRAGLRERRVWVSTQTPRVSFADYPRPGRRGIFTPERVWVETEAGQTLAERSAPRAAFKSLRRSFFWDQLDLLYFSGYALWNYLTTPFLLEMDGVEIQETSPWQERGQTWRRLKARFPSTIPTHCSEQVFYFDERGWLRRLDYNPEVFASWAAAAHYCEDHRSFVGLVIPTRRYVVPRTPAGGSRPKPILVWIAISDVTRESSDK